MADAGIYRITVKRHGKPDKHYVGMTDGRKRVLDAMIAANTGRKLAPESIAKRTAKQTGIRRSEETKRKMALAKIGRTLSEETRRKISETKKARGQCPPRP